MERFLVILSINMVFLQVKLSSGMVLRVIILAQDRDLLLIRKVMS